MHLHGTVIEPERHGFSKAFKWLLPLLSLALAMLLGSCGNRTDPLSSLSDKEQIQALILKALAQHVFLSDSGDEDSMRIFLGCSNGNQFEPAIEVSENVFKFVSVSFPSARKLSAISNEKGYLASLLEHGTRKQGIRILVGKILIHGDGPVTVESSYYVNGKDAAGIIFQMQRVNGKWTIVSREQVWIS